MILREPLSLTWLLISVLALAFSGELFAVFSSHREADCHQRNVWLLEGQKQGPLQECE
jgi:hypothetical protein